MFQDEGFLSQVSLANGMMAYIDYSGKQHRWWPSNVEAGKAARAGYEAANQEIEQQAEHQLGRKPTQRELRHYGIEPMETRTDAELRSLAAQSANQPEPVNPFAARIDELTDPTRFHDPAQKRQEKKLIEIYKRLAAEWENEYADATIPSPDRTPKPGTQAARDAVEEIIEATRWSNYLTVLDREEMQRLSKLSETDPEQCKKDCELFKVNWQQKIVDATAPQISAALAAS
ncbi:MAG: hypothetical protein WCB27_16085 [Thermoguttaceae bacterium]